VSLVTGKGVKLGERLYSPSANILLQKTFLQERNSVWLNPVDVESAGLSECESVTVQQGDGRVVMSLFIDSDIPEGCLYMLSATNKAALLGASYGPVAIQGDC